MTEPYVRPARSADLVSFAAALGDPAFLNDRFDRQLNNDGVLFLAWLDCRPAGEVYLWLEKAEEALIRWHLPRVPLITHLEVAPTLRNRGIGQALVEAAEQYLVENGRRKVALAVRTDNLHAARLYDRLEYQDWGHGEVTCYTQTTLPDGRVVREPERCHVLTKDLVPITPSPRSEARAIGAAQPW
ncbi:GNAT family N-acetyltransferase [Amycolatopsis sp. NPDC051758]|uniref:GNAT family N-acetyltransferase n=1 Tax=Amycolatopsis sp. NPDC051758 TaxID=3363935 RepID=UPI003789790C